MSSDVASLPFPPSLIFARLGSPTGLPRCSMAIDVADLSTVATLSCKTDENRSWSSSYKKYINQLKIALGKDVMMWWLSQETHTSGSSYQQGSAGRVGSSGPSLGALGCRSLWLHRIHGPGRDHQADLAAAYVANCWVFISWFRPSCQLHEGPRDTYADPSHVSLVQGPLCLGIEHSTDFHAGLPVVKMVDIAPKPGSTTFLAYL